MIRFRWETVRIAGDAEPGRLERAVRRALSEQGGNWKVTIGRTVTGWRLQMEAAHSLGARLRAVKTTLASPIASEAELAALLLDALRM